MEQMGVRESPSLVLMDLDLQSQASLRLVDFYEEGQQEVRNLVKGLSHSH
jgi:hypothetical protein